MQYDILNQEGSINRRGGVIYPQRLSMPIADRYMSTLYEKVDEDGVEVLRRVPAPGPVEFPTHFVVCCDPDTDDVWRIYAGPFTKDIAGEICDALNLAQEA